MDNVLKNNTWQFRSAIAEKCGISKQGFASKADADPIRFLILIFEALVSIGRKRNAQMIWADVCERVEAVFSPVRRFSLVEVVRTTQTVFALEIDDNRNRHDLLQAWRELALAARSRIQELTLALEPTGFGVR